MISTLINRSSGRAAARSAVKMFITQPSDGCHGRWDGGSVLICLICAFVFGVFNCTEAFGSGIVEAAEASGAPYSEAVNIVNPSHEKQVSPFDGKGIGFIGGNGVRSPEYMGSGLSSLEHDLAFDAILSLPRSLCGQVQGGRYIELIMNLFNNCLRPPRLTM